MSTVFGPNIGKLPKSIWELIGQNGERAVHDEIKLGLISSVVRSSLLTTNTDGEYPLTVIANTHNLSNFELIIQKLEELHKNGELSDEQQQTLSDMTAQTTDSSFLSKKMSFKSGDNDHLPKRFAQSPLTTKEQKMDVLVWMKGNTASFGHTDSQVDIEKIQSMVFANTPEAVNAAQEQTATA